MKRILLTGIGGSIGVHTFTHIMANTDWDVVGIDSFRHKGLCDRTAKVLDDNPEWESRLTMVTHDLKAPVSDLTRGVIGHIDCIISMASLSDVEESIHNPVEFVSNNVAIVLNTLEFARAINPSMFIQFSTDEVYGAADPDSAHKEWSTILPSNPYSASKASQEAIAIAYWRTYGVPIVITNVGNNFGQMQQSRKFPVIIQKKVSSGETLSVHGKTGNIGSRFYIHSRNTSDALLWIIRNTVPAPHQPGEIDRPDRYNIGGETVLTNLELAEKIADLMGMPLKYQLADHGPTRPGYDNHYRLDGGKIQDLGWKAPVSFDDSLRATIKWQQENPDWIRDDE